MSLVVDEVEVRRAKCERRTTELDEKLKAVEEGCVVLAQREANLELEWTQRTKERKQANAASRIQSVFRAMTMQRVAHELLGAAKSKKKADARHALLRKNKRDLQKSWDAVRVAEKRAHEDAVAGEAKKEDALTLHRRCQAEEKEVGERRRALEESERTAKEERSVLDAEVGRLRETAHMLDRQAKLLAEADGDLTARASDLVARTRLVAKVERYAHRMAATREDLRAKGRRLEEREKRYLETQSRSSAVYVDCT